MISVRVSFPPETMATSENRFATELNGNEVIELLKTQHQGA